MLAAQRSAAGLGSASRRCVKASRPVFSSRVAKPVRRGVVEVQAAVSGMPMPSGGPGMTSQVRDGRVRNISTADVAAMQKDGWVVLDVRPPTEQAKAPVAGSVHVPLFVPDPDQDLGALVKRATDFAMGSWWMGGTHYVPNKQFLGEVQAKVPKDSRIIVACQKGLRSLAACEQLATAGYQQLAWINGGFDTARKGHIETSNNKDIRYAGIGGLSEVLGWTEVQREEKGAGMLGGMNGVIRVFSIILLADILLFAYEQVAYWQQTGTGPFAQ